MPHFTCTCGKEFYSKHRVAKFCSRSCSNRHNQKGVIRIPDDELLARLLTLAGELGRTPTTREVSNEPYLRRRFGSYNKAVIAAGLTPNIKLPDSFFQRERSLVSLSLRYKILKRDSFKCTYCGGTPAKGYILHVDHITPRSKGGDTVETNLTTACWLCNTGKSNYD